MGTQSSKISVTAVERLPVLPQVAMKVTERMQSPTATLNEISNLIKSDAGLSSKVLRLANSSYYSIPGGVTEVNKALQYLGFTTIAQIVLTTSVFGAFQSAGVQSFPLKAFWTHSFAVGQVAEIAARALQLANTSDAFIGGLLHDLGKLVILEIAPERLGKITSFAKEQNCSFLQAEQELGLDTHVEVGVTLAKHWHLPPVILSAIEFHHSQGSSNDTTDQLIEWANLWVHSHQIGASGSFDQAVAEKLANLQERLKLNAKMLNSIESTFQKEFEKAGAILGGH